jgi:hypothetical protein
MADAEVTTSPTGEAIKGKVKFGLNQVNNKTPEFANWIFRGYFVISKALIGWLAAIKWLDTSQIYNVTITITLLIDPIMLGFSKLFGIEPTVPEQPANKTAD